MIFGINKKVLEELYNKAKEYVDGKVNPLSEKEAGLTNRISGHDIKIDEIQKKYDSLVNEITEIIEYRLRIESLEDKLDELDKLSNKSGIVSDAVFDKSKITFDTVKDLAVKVSDAAYEKIRDYFLLEMAKKGFEGEKPSFLIYDSDSRYSVAFSVEDKRGYSNSYETTKYKIEHFTKFVTQENRSLRSYSPLPYAGSDQFFSLSVSSDNNVSLREKLQEDLPKLLQAYMLGYSLKCLDEKNFDAALNVQEKHGLKENSALLGKMSEIMQKDPKLADKFLAYYPLEKKDI